MASELDESTPLLVEDVATQDQNLNNDLADPERTRAETPASDSCDDESTRPKSPMASISVLLIGVFISQTDTTLVLATYGSISSEFHDLESGSWLISTYMLAMCVSQPFFGKLSDIYGRKRCLQTAYTLFAVGTVGCGLGLSMGQIITARAVQGAGGAGMVSMVSILLTDLVPIQEVAQYRSYVNVVQTLGRSCGGVIGGFLTSTIGWRWAFFIQCPPIFVSILLVEWKLDVVQHSLANGRDESSRDKLKRIDFLGGMSLSVTILSGLLVLDTGGQKFPWSHPAIIVAAAVAVVAAITFCLIERYWAKEPIFPLKLLTHYVVVTSYTIASLQIAAQMTLMFVIPIYYQAAMDTSTGVAGAAMIPSVLGNTVGGLLTGFWIKRTGRYKLPTIIACAFSAIAFTLMSIMWWGRTGILGSLVIFPGGFATGITQSAVFIGLTSGIEAHEVAVAVSGMYLSVNVGSVSGISGASAVFQVTLRKALRKALAARSDAAEIISNALSDISYIQNVEGYLRDLMLPAYISALHAVFTLGLALACIAFVVALVTRERKLLQ